jgi:hypothetical protein
VRFLCSALAGKKYSPIKITVDGGSANDRIQLGIGICKLPHEDFVIDTQAGVMANWGQQDQAIGIVGLGLIFPKAAFVRFVDLPSEHQVVLAVERKKEVQYLIQGDWLNGRRFPRCPNIDNWVEELKAVASDQ